MGPANKSTASSGSVSSSSSSSSSSNNNNASEDVAPEQEVALMVGQVLEDPLDSEDEKVLKEISKMRTEIAEVKRQKAKSESRKRNLDELEDLRKEKRDLVGETKEISRYDNVSFSREKGKEEKDIFTDWDGIALQDKKGHENARMTSTPIRRALAHVTYEAASSQQSTVCNLSTIHQQVALCFRKVKEHGFLSPEGGVMTGNFLESAVRMAVGANAAQSRLMAELGLFESFFSASGPAWDLSVFGPKGAGTELRDTCDQLKTFSAFFRVLNPDTPDTAEALIKRLESGGDLNCL